MFERWHHNKSVRSAHNWVHYKRFFANKVSLADVTSLLLEKILMYNIDQRAAAVAFHFTLSIFPTILVLFTLIPYIPIPNLAVDIMTSLRAIMPRGLYDFVAATVYDIVGRPNGGILSFGVVLALMTATNGTAALMTAFNMADDISKRTRSYLRARLLSMLFTMVLLVVLLLSVSVIFVGGFFVDLLNQHFLQNSEAGIYLLNTLRYGVIFGSFLVVIALMYRYLPKLKHGWRLFNFGAWVASFLIILATFAFSYYLSKFNSYNKLYGSIGTIIALMYWFYLIALLLIFGYELNISIWKAKHSCEKWDR